MSDSNGDGVQHVSAILKQAEEALRNSEGLLCRDWITDYPNLRAVLLGIEFGGLKWAAGTLTIRRDGHEIAAQLTITDYAYQCTLRDVTVRDLLERFEGHLDCQTTPWDKTWKEKQLDKQRIAKARSGS